MTYLIHELN